MSEFDTIFNQKPCKISDPNGWKIEELKELAFKYFNIDRNYLKDLSYLSLCRYLKNPSLIPDEYKISNIVKNDNDNIIELVSVASTSKPINIDKEELIIEDIDINTDEIIQEEIEDDTTLDDTEDDHRLEQILSFIKTENINLTETVDECITNCKLPLKKYQINAVNFISNNRGIIAAWEVGSGKTIFAMTSAICFLKKNPDGIVFISTPKSLVSNFFSSFYKYFGVQETKNLPGYAIKLLSKISYFTHDGLINKFKDEINQSLIREKKDELKSFPKKCMIIIDEGHNFRTRIKYHKGTDSITTGKKAYNMIKLCQKAEKVIILTATPLYNSHYDAVNLICMAKGLPFLRYKDIIIIHNNENIAINFYMNVFSFHKTSKIDRPGYPSLTEKDVKIVMSKEFQKIYTKFEMEVFEKNDNLKNFNVKFISRPYIFLVGLRIYTNKFLGDCPKCDVAINITVDAFKKKEKIIIASSYLSHGVYQISKLLNQKRIPHGIITGKTSKEDRTKIVEEFNKDKIYVIIISAKAGGEGLDLKGCRHVILFESLWNYSGEDQIIGRAFRLSSHDHLPENQRTVTVHRLRLTKDENYIPEELLSYEFSNQTEYVNDESFDKKSYNKERIISTNKLKSADDELLLYIQEKYHNIRRFYKFLYKLSISDEDIYISPMREDIVTKHKDYLKRLETIFTKGT